MFLDLDKFKSLNDTHGHEAGDQLLQEVTRRLTGCVREVDTVARFGGDEFVVLLGDLVSERQASTAQTAVVAEKIRVALQEAYVLTISNEGGADKVVEHHCTASIGVAVFIDHEASEDDIIKWADAAMYQAKHAGGNTIRFHDF
jgi:diguanylate cyclase (GGDEF)-like protein